MIYDWLCLQVALKKDALLLEKLMLTLQKNVEDDSNAIELQDRKELVLNDPRLQKFMIRRNRSENRKTGVCNFTLRLYTERRNYY